MRAVATTFIAGVLAVRKGYGRPIGSLTQMGTIRLGKRTDKRVPMIKEFIPLSNLDDMVFGGWDIFDDDMCTAAISAGVLDENNFGSGFQIASAGSVGLVFHQHPWKPRRRSAG